MEMEKSYLAFLFITGFLIQQCLSLIQVNPTFTNNIMPSALADFDAGWIATYYLNTTNNFYYLQIKDSNNAVLTLINCGNKNYSMVFVNGTATDGWIFCGVMNSTSVDVYQVKVNNSSHLIFYTVVNTTQIKFGKINTFYIGDKQANKITQYVYNSIAMIISLNYTLISPNNESALISIDFNDHLLI